MTKEEFLKKYNLVDLNDYPDIKKDIRYSTVNNFTNEVLYDEPFCYLRKETFEKLLKAKEIFDKYNYSIVIWDCLRPLPCQQKMWDLIHDERFVSNPAKGNSIHCKGSAIDLTLCDSEGNYLKMPTEFDHFGKESFRSYYEFLDKETYNNIKLLETTMIACGFEPFETEWWHYTDTEDYDYIREFYE